MKDERDSKRPAEESTLYQSTLTIAMVAGVVCVILLALLGLRYLRYGYVLPRQENRLDQIKKQLGEQPNNETLLEEARELDLQTRATRSAWYDLTRCIVYLLLFNVSVFLIALNVLFHLRKNKPCPDEPVKYSEQTDRTSAGVRAGIFVIVLIMGASVVYVAGYSTNIDYSATGDSEQSPEPAERTEPPPDREDILANWPRFRGPSGRGVASQKDIPRSWDIESGKNILWKSEIPMKGQNSPVVWGDRVFLTGATKEERKVYCYDSNSGELLWDRRVPELDVRAEDIELNDDTGYAPSTSYTDGRQVYVYFPTGDVAAFDYEGNRQWLVNLGEPDNVYGHATSLTGYKNHVIIQYDNGDIDDDGSFLIALDWETGEEVWKKSREVMNSWTTPIIINTDYGQQLITVSNPYMIAYDPADGSVTWRGKVMSGEIAPSPIYDDGLIMAITPNVKMLAVEPQEDGTIEDTDFKWTIERGVPDIPTPVSDGERVYLLGTYGGALAAHSLDNGEQVWKEFLDGDFYASPVVAGDHLYLFSASGVCHIVEAGDEFAKVGEYSLGEPVQASPAFVDGRMYVRGKNHLFCIGETE